MGGFVRLGCGVLGVIAVGFFNIDKGLLYGHGTHLLEVQCITLWTGNALLSLLPFKLMGRLRVDIEGVFRL